jgi:hypothetical protein
VIAVVGSLKSTLATSISSSDHVDYEEVALLNAQHVLQLYSTHCPHGAVRVGKEVKFPLRMRNGSGIFRYFLCERSSLSKLATARYTRYSHDTQNLNIREPQLYPTAS